MIACGGLNLALGIVHLRVRGTTPLLFVIVVGCGSKAYLVEQLEVLERPVLLRDSLSSKQFEAESSLCRAGFKQPAVNDSTKLPCMTHQGCRAGGIVLRKIFSRKAGFTRAHHECAGR